MEENIFLQNVKSKKSINMLENLKWSSQKVA